MQDDNRPLTDEENSQLERGVAMLEELSGLIGELKDDEFDVDKDGKIAIHNPRIAARARAIQGYFELQVAADNIGRPTQITFNTDGTAQHVGENSLLVGSVAKSTKRRASHVIPVNPILRAAFYLARAFGLDSWTRTWKCVWQVRIVDGPVLPKLYSDRAEAIRDEIAWLEANRL